MDNIDALLAGIEAGAVPAGVFCEDVVLDATVPNWRFTARGAPAVRAELAHWFADPGDFVDLHRSRLDDGELVEFTLTWDEDGVTHMCHQAHIVRLRDGQIASDTAFCGGRWPASLIAEMAAAPQTAG
ncbi:MAG TPA: hypothetical protein VED59_03590 [Acidimicrobiales bacterium]|nr:hypothetical protein [Acidimicrobiales bacterium]